MPNSSSAGWSSTLARCASESRVRNRIVSLDPLFGAETAAESPMGRSHTADRTLGDLQTNSMAWTACRDTMSARRLKLCQALVGRQASPAQISGSTSRAEQQARRNRRARMHSICELMQILLNGATLVSMQIQSCNHLRLFTRTRQLFNDRASAHSREGFRALRSHYAGSPVGSMREAAQCTAGDCAVLQPGNGEAEAPGGGRWVLRSHNDTMAFSLSKTPLPMILGPSWNSQLNLCDP
jgi:hypothetical protein